MSKAELERAISRWPAAPFADPVDTEEEAMSTGEWIGVALAVVIVAIVLMLVAARAASARRRAHLQERFGPEYDRTVEAAASRGDAEKTLAEREREREGLDVKPLSAAAQQRFLADWRGVQQRFVDDPETAATEAEQLVRRVMRERGYPTDEGQSRRADVMSVDHPEVVDRYRNGCEALATRSGGSEEQTENLRRAMVDFRTVFETLLDGDRDLSAVR